MQINHVNMLKWQEKHNWHALFAQIKSLQNRAIRAVNNRKQPGKELLPIKLSEWQMSETEEVVVLSSFHGNLWLKHSASFEDHWFSWVTYHAVFHTTLCTSNFHNIHWDLISWKPLEQRVTSRNYLTCNYM